MNDSSCVFEIIYNTMQQSHNTMSAKTLCEIAGASRSGYYAWVKAASARELREQQNRNDFQFCYLYSLESPYFFGSLLFFILKS